jgi:serine/threonine protein kinase
MSEDLPRDPDSTPTLGPDAQKPAERPLGREEADSVPTVVPGGSVSAGERPTVAGEPAPAPPPAAKPRTLGPYEILGELGRGGMGVVYKAFHPGLKRVVALKVLIAGEDASEEAIARFHREAEAVAKLGHHPNIVPVYDIGQVPGHGAGGTGHIHYIAMHFVEGKPLDKMIDEGTIPPKRAAEIAKKVAEGLAHAHAHGILHRDIKPANILMAKGRADAMTNPKSQRNLKSQITTPAAGGRAPRQSSGHASWRAWRCRLPTFDLGPSTFDRIRMGADDHRLRAGQRRRVRVGDDAFGGDPRHAPVHAP